MARISNRRLERCNAQQLPFVVDQPAWAWFVRMIRWFEYRIAANLAKHVIRRQHHPRFLMEKADQIAGMTRRMQYTPCITGQLQRIAFVNGLGHVCRTHQGEQIGVDLADEFADRRGYTPGYEKF